MKKIKHTAGEFTLKESFKDFEGREIVGGNNFKSVIAVTCISDPIDEIEEEVGNARLLKLSPTAPHHCADPKCPGDINRRKLELFDKMRDSLKAVMKFWGESDDEDMPGKMFDEAWAAIKKAESI